MTCKIQEHLQECKRYKMMARAAVLCGAEEKTGGAAGGQQPVINTLSFSLAVSRTDGIRNESRQRSSRF